jgi:hypothetical protein
MEGNYPSFLNIFLKVFIFLMVKTYKSIESPKGEFGIHFNFIRIQIYHIRCHIKAPGFLHSTIYRFF